MADINAHNKRDNGWWTFHLLRSQTTRAQKLFVDYVPVSFKKIVRAKKCSQKWNNTVSGLPVHVRIFW